MKCQYQNHPARSLSPFQMNSESRDVEMCVDGGGEKNEKTIREKEGGGGKGKGERIFRQCEKGKKPAPTSQRSERDVWTIMRKETRKRKKEVSPTSQRREPQVK